MDKEKLFELAKEARLNAITDISGFKVGAALLAKDGKVFLGCNIEDRSGIGVTNICAERCAMIKALSEGYREFEAIAVAGGKDDLVFCTPCGVCRQYLNTFCPDIEVICVDKDGAIKAYALDELLPYSFSETF
ncbi:MAG: cytidine deaminase [Oscillospiraceae bacterium]|nr:cytidine deaminase [Oscillospiraceae bacterium]